MVIKYLFTDVNGRFSLKRHSIPVDDAVPSTSGLTDSSSETPRINILESTPVHSALAHVQRPPSHEVQVGGRRAEEDLVNTPRPDYHNHLSISSPGTQPNQQFFPAQRKNMAAAELSNQSEDSFLPLSEPTTRGRVSPTLSDHSSLSSVTFGMYELIHSEAASLDGRASSTPLPNGRPFTTKQRETR